VCRKPLLGFKKKRLKVSEKKRNKHDFQDCKGGRVGKVVEREELNTWPKANTACSYTIFME
jgi:hypothetical protein